MNLTDTVSVLGIAALALCALVTRAPRPQLRPIPVRANRSGSRRA